MPARRKTLICPTTDLSTALPRRSFARSFAHTLFYTFTMNATAGTYIYITRIIPALSVLALVTVIIFSFVIEPYGHGQNSSSQFHDPAAATSWQLALSAYTILLHLMSIAFPARVCWAMGDVIRHLKESASIKDSPKKRRGQTLRGDRGSTALQIPMFVIILPAYKEEITTLEETLRVLASHPRAQQSYHVGQCPHS